MKRILLVLALLVATGAAAQPASRPPVAGPTPPPAAGRGDLWQMLTPAQRDQLWGLLSPQQKADLWRGLEPSERFEVRQRMRRADPPGVVVGPRRHGHPPGRGDDPAYSAMTPEERRQMREQIREAHRARRERMEAEGARQRQ